jgi:hypothetical protein
VTSRLVDRDRVALLREQSRVRAVARRVIWRAFGSAASSELVERVVQAVFEELHLCCSECAAKGPARR